MQSKQLAGVAIIVVAVLVIAGAFVLLKAPTQATTTSDFKEADDLLSDLEDYMSFENQDYTSGTDDAFSGW